MDKPKLGATTEYPTRYTPELLVSIPRADARGKLPAAMPFEGLDLWTAYELSWLDPMGKPCVTVAEFAVDCHSPCIVESKSFKLYLNSFNQEKIPSRDVLSGMLVRDLSAAFGGPVSVEIFTLDEYAAKGVRGFKGLCLDDLPVHCRDYHPEPSFLKTEAGGVITETLYSHLLKSNCPVTGQPDWASLAVSYTGQRIQWQGLLQYLVSYREHQDFHENCVERIFTDIQMQCRPVTLSVYARYTRRGGLDINPYRTTDGSLRPDWLRLARQ